MLRLTPIALVAFITTALNCLVFYLSWRRQRSASARYFTWGTLALTWWTLMVAFDYAAVPIPLKIFFAKLEYLGSGLALVCFARFALLYGGAGTSLRHKHLPGLYGFLALSNIVLAWTNDWHGWLWSSFTPSPVGGNLVIFEYGPLYFWSVLSAYLLFLAIVIPLWQATQSRAYLFRRQARWLLAASLVPVMGNLIYLFEPPALQGMDWSSIFFSLVSLLFLLALYQTRLLDLTPIAHHTILSNLGDGMIVLDDQNHIVDINPLAAHLALATPPALLGRSLTTAMPALSALLQHPADQETKTELALASHPPRYFEVTLSPLHEGPHRIGQLILLRDITQRTQLETDRQAWLSLLQATFDSVASGILVMDEQGHILLANKRMALIWPIAAAQLLSLATLPRPDTTPTRLHFAASITPYLKNASEITEFIEAHQQNPTEEGMIRLRFTDGRIFDVRTAPYYLGATFLGQIWTFENVTQRLQNDQSEILTNERLRISQEAHDGLLQGLVGLRLQLKAWHTLLDQNPARLHPQIDELQAFVTESIGEMQRFIFALRPAALEAGFFTSVHQLAAGMQRYYQLPVAIEICGAETNLPNAWQQPLFRVIQESLSNVGKHARATHAWVNLDLSDPQIFYLTIRDDGRGFDPNAPSTHGLGLDNLTQRIKSLNGQLTIDSQPDRGTVVQINVPYNSLS